MSAKTGGTILLLAFVAVSLGYLIVNELRPPAAATAQLPAAATGGSSDAVGTGDSPAAEGRVAEDAPAADPAAEAARPVHKVIAYYFHNTQRCMTCNKIERLAEEALREQFVAALQKGELEWRVVNMEEPPNTHFARDYQLVASSLVLVDVHEGAQREWTNMEKVWQYVHENEAEFKRYVAEQARKYLESQ